MTHPIPPKPFPEFSSTSSPGGSPKDSPKDSPKGPLSPRVPSYSQCRAIMFLMDPLSKVIAHKDTSIMFMAEFIRRGYAVYHVAQGDVSLISNHIRFRATPISAIDFQAKQPFTTLPACIVEAHTVSAVMIRTDPPVDEAYIHDLWMLDLLPPSVYVMNRPCGIRTVNEKLWCTRFRDITPPTVVTRRVDDFLTCLNQFESVILKPVNGFGGQGVFKLHRDDTNAKVAFETLSQGRDVMIQPFIPAADQGDKRILLCHGDPLGAILRVHAKGDHRNNFFAGGQWQATSITERDLHIISVLAPHLRDYGLDFVGIDIIGDMLIEVNVTSPTCLQEMNRAYSVQLERQVVDFIETQLS